MSDICDRLQTINNRIADAVDRYNRPAGSVSLLAVSKGQPLDKIRQAVSCGQRRFGENYLQEAEQKIEALAQQNLEWHFIGPVQSNKTTAIAVLFDWVHSVDRLKIATRLSQQRPQELPPLQMCLQVNLEREETKAGITEDQLEDLAAAVMALPHINLRGLMAIPVPTDEINRQRAAFAKLRQAKENLNHNHGYHLDTLSIGMTNDMEAAIAEGSTIVRIGTGVFGPRPG